MLKIGRVYKIISTQGNECYVGSTFNTTRDRFKTHKKHYNEWKLNLRKNTISAFTLFEKYGVESCRIILIKQYEVYDKEHLYVYETLWIKKLRSINEIEPSGGLLKIQRKHQWYEENKERCLTKNKNYYQANKSEILQQQKEYYRINLKMIQEQSRNYYKTHREQKLNYQKSYAAKNKEVIKEKKRLKRNCEICSTDIRIGNFAKHQKTTKHQINLTKAYFALLPFSDL